MATTDNSERVGRTFWISIVSALLILPLINFFVIDYLEYCFSGDITKEFVYHVMYYLSEGLAFVLKYIAMASIIFAAFRLHRCAKTITLILAIISLLLPYASVFFIAYFETSNFATLFEYYLVSASVNFGIDTIICALILALSVIVKSRCKLEQNKYFLRAIIIGSCIHFLAELSVLIYETVYFILELKYEYYDSMTTNEIIKVIASYISVIIKSILGYFVMRVYTYFLCNTVPKAID